MKFHSLGINDIWTYVPSSMTNKSCFMIIFSTKRPAESLISEDLVVVYLSDTNKYMIDKYIEEKKKDHRYYIALYALTIRGGKMGWSMIDSNKKAFQKLVENDHFVNADKYSDLLDEEDDIDLDAFDRY